jgi:ribosomal protein S12 methylthiotransferase accessory factor
MIGRVKFYSDNILAQIGNYEVSCKTVDSGRLLPLAYDVFYASVMLCSGTHVEAFCKARNIPTANIHFEVHFDVDTYSTKPVDVIKFHVGLPPDFPEKYVEAVRRSVELCKVIETFQDQPELIFDVQIVDQLELAGA